MLDFFDLPHRVTNALPVINGSVFEPIRFTDRMRYLFLLSFWTLFLFFQHPLRTVAEPQAAPKPLVQVSFERQSIREADSIKANIWMSNEGDQTLTDIKMHVAGPDFLTWYSDSCEGCDTKNGLDLEPLNPNQTINFTVRFKTGPRIVVGEFNTLFTFTYTWHQQQKSGRSFVALEKPLKASLFGSDTVAGVPLALASYVVPGLFFWLILSIDYFKFPWAIKDVALGDRLIYSLVVSFLIIWVGNRFKFPDENSGISLKGLFIYALVGGGLGSLVGVVSRLQKHISEKRAQEAQRKIDEVKKLADAKLIDSSDTDDVLLEKLLELYPNRRKPKTIVSFPDDGREFIGSLGAKTDDFVALVGWFKIDSDMVPKTAQEEFATLYKENRLLDLLQLARKLAVPIEALDPIYEVADGTETALDSQSGRWSNEGQSVRPAREQSQWEALSYQ